MADDDAPPLEGRAPLSLTLSVSMKVNLGKYESADAFLSIRNVTAATTQEEIDALLDGNGKIAYDALKVRLQEKVQGMRRRDARSDF